MKRLAALAILLASTALAQAADPAVPGGIVERLDPALDALIAPNAEIETLVTADGFFEGPVWMHGKEGNFLLFSDLVANRVNKWQNGMLSTYIADVFKGKDQSSAISQPRGGKPYVQIGPNGETLDKQGRLVFCAMGSGRIMRREADGTLTELASSYMGHHLNAPNDLVLKSDGTVYFTDIRAGLVTKDENPPEGVPETGVYRIKNGAVERVASGLEAPNGIAFSPDEKFLYVNDIRTKIVMRYPVQADGTLGTGAIFIDMRSDERPGAPDGMKIDSRGNIWDAGPGGVWVVSPEGRHLGTIRVPERISNLAWGDDDAMTIYMTSATLLTRMRVKVPGLRP